MSAVTGICGCHYELWTGFGDVLFDIMADQRSGVYRDWIIKPRVELTPIPGTNRTYVEHMGFDPARVTWTIAFDCIHHYHALLERYMTTDTLTVLYGFQSLKGTPWHQHGRTYERLDNVLLVDIGDSPHYVDGTIEVDVTFQRAVDPVTREAVIA